MDNINTNEPKSANTQPEETAEQRYLRKKARFDSFYLQLVICCAVVAAAAIAVAVLARVSIGIAVAAVLVIIYVYFRNDELSRDLGLSCSAIEGGLRVSRLNARDADTAYIPQRLMWQDVTVLGKDMLASGQNEQLIRLYLPATLKQLEGGAFDGAPALSEIYFEGTAEQLDALNASGELSSFSVICDSPYPKKEAREKSSKKNKHQKS